jgi:GGDEF domain-containing protein
MAASQSREMMVVVGKPGLSFDVRSEALFGAAVALAALPDEQTARALVADWRCYLGRTSANPDSTGRYPFLVDTRHAPLPGYVPPRDEWQTWHPSEQEVYERDPGRALRSLVLPPVLADNVELLDLLASGGDEAAAEVLGAVLPVARRDFARYAEMAHAWTDTWALWQLARRPRALRRLHPFALAVAESYAERAVAAGGVGTGSRFPFHDRPMVSVSAQLAAGLLALGVHPKLVGQLAAWVASQARGDGAWADAREPPDPLTTLVAADLLGGLEPSWDSAPTLAWIDARRRPDGLLVAMGPEAAWLTLAADELAERLARPFPARFRWPQLAVEQRDRRTGLPFLGYVADLARLFAEVPSLMAAPVSLAFLDLAGFGEWNNRFGMAAGDEVLRFLASELASVPGAVAVRDGGDEFVLVAAPGDDGLPGRMRSLREAFPRRFRARFGEDAPPVAMRVVTTTVGGAALERGRDLLGVEIARLKAAHPRVPPEGVQAAVDSGGWRRPG